MTSRITHATALLALALGFLIFLWASGVSASSSVFILLVIAVQAWGGWSIWRSLRSNGSFVEMIGMSLAIGTALSAMSGVAIRAVVDTTAGWLLPAVVGVVLVIYRRRVNGVGGAGPLRVDRGVLAAVVLGFAVGTAGLFVSMRSYPLSWVGTWSGYHGDMLFFEALGASLAGSGPLASIFSPDTIIRYHWLTYGWTGFLTDVTGADPFVVLTRVLPMVTLVIAVTIAAAWARRISQITWVPVLAVALIVTGGYAGASYGTVLNFDSPSTSLTTVWLMAGVLLVLLRIELFTPRIATLALVGLLSAAMTAGKISTGFLFVTALAALAAIGLVRRMTWRTNAIHMLLSAGIGALLAYLFVIAGSADPGGLGLLSWVDRASSVQGLNPIPGYLGAGLGTLVLVLAVIARWAGALWLLRDRATRWTPTAAVAIGLAIGGIMPLLLVSGGINETWFALSASAPLSVLSAGGIGLFIEHAKAKSTRPIRTGLLVSIPAAAAMWIILWLLWSTGPSGGNVWEYTLRWAGPVVVFLGAVLLGQLIGRMFFTPRQTLGITLLILVFVAMPSRFLSLGSAEVGTQPGTRGDLFSGEETFANGLDQQFVIGWSQGEIDAANWVTQNVASDDLIATNKTLSPLIAALSGRPTYVSGMHYQAPYGWADNIPMLLSRESQSWAFIDAPSADTWSPLCSAGVTHLWIDPRRTATKYWAPWGNITVAKPEVVLVAITTDAFTQCP